MAVTPTPALPPARIGQIEITVKDIERATDFYRDVIGLQHLFSAPPGLSFFRCGEVRIMLARPEGAGETPPASILYYAVDDVEAAYRGLAERGAEVVAKPHIIHKTETSELWMAFFRDGEGNTFAVMSEVPVAASGS